MVTVTIDLWALGEAVGVVVVGIWAVVVVAVLRDAYRLRLKVERYIEMMRNNTEYIAKFGPMRPEGVKAARSIKGGVKAFRWWAKPIAAVGWSVAVLVWRVKGWRG